VWGGHLEKLKQEMEAGTARDCFIGELVKQRQTIPEEKWEELALDDYALGKRIRIRDLEVSRRTHRGLNCSQDTKLVRIPKNLAQSLTLYFVRC
jgi:hypothetical protein